MLIGSPSMSYRLDTTTVLSHQRLTTMTILKTMLRPGRAISKCGWLDLATYPSGRCMRHSGEMADRVPSWTSSRTTKTLTTSSMFVIRAEQKLMAGQSSSLDRPRYSIRCLASGKGFRCVYSGLPLIALGFCWVSHLIQAHKVRKLSNI
jgi:hypothetical protein